MELVQQVVQPAAFSGRIGYASVLSLGAGAPHHGLSLRRPRDEGVAEVDTIS